MRRRGAPQVAVFGPCARVGVELRILYDQVLDAAVETPVGMAHAVGGRRLRLLSSKASAWPDEGAITNSKLGAPLQLAELEVGRAQLRSACCV